MQVMNRMTKDGCSHPTFDSDTKRQDEEEEEEEENS